MKAAFVMTDVPLDFEFLSENGVPFKRFDAGEKIFLQDEAGDFMYAVKSGRVNIITYGTVLENVGPNGLFGEMALIDDSPRSAAAIAAEDTEVAAIDKQAFLSLVAHEPKLALKIMGLLADRIRRMNDSL